MKKLYIMISKTDTGVGWIIRGITQYPYNHVSLTLDGTFRNWVSFARFHLDTPLYGGFIREPVERFLAKGQRIDVRIFAIEISDLWYAQLDALFGLAGTQDPSLIYNYLSLVTAIGGIDVPISGAYTCLGFANTVLGTNHRQIRNLDTQLAPLLIYDGSLEDLAADSGRRNDPYFTRLGLQKGIYHSIQSMGRLTWLLLHPSHADPVSKALSRQVPRGL